MKYLSNNVPVNIVNVIYLFMHKNIILYNFKNACSFDNILMNIVFTHTHTNTTCIYYSYI